MEPTISSFSDARLRKLDELFTGYILRNDLPSASIVVRHGRSIVFKEKYGWQDIEAGIPLSFDTIFRIMSMTKPVTAVAAMLLYEEGKFDLNTPVESFLPAFKNMKVLHNSSREGLIQVEAAQHPITFRHLFTHTSGIGYYGDSTSLLADFYQDALAPFVNSETSYSIQDFVGELAKLPIAFEPGSSWLYGFNLDVLGALIEVISDRPLDVFLKERVFSPLGMSDTDFFLPESKNSRLAVLYARDPEGNGLVRQDMLVPLPVAMWGGGGLVSTLDDYGRFAAMLANQGLLDDFQFISPTTIAMFSTNYISPEAKSAFASASPEINSGYGFSLGTAVLLDPQATGRFGNIGEFYWGGAFSTYFWIDPVESLSAVVMTQLNPNWAYPIPWQVHQLVYQALIKPRS